MANENESDLGGPAAVYKRYRFDLLLLLLLNIGLAGLKLYLGFAGDSSAMRSDGWNNSADVFYTIFLLGGLWWSTRPPDRSHPEGHERIESLITTIVSLVIVGTGLYVMRDSYLAFLGQKHVELGRAGVMVIMLSVALKGFISWRLIAKGRELQSSVLTAVGYDQAADILADLSVLVVIFTASFGISWIDPLVAAGIGVLILKVGLEPLVESVRELTGWGASEKIINDIKSRVEETEFFSNPQSIRAHYVGPSLHVSLVVEAPGELSLSEVHAAEDNLRERIEALPEIARAFVHIMPETDE